MRTIPVALLAVVALAGCAAPPPSPFEPPDPATGEVSAVATVIDDGDGAELCPVVLESYPPQCGGAIPLDGWSWDGLDGVSEEGAVRWGVFRVVGHWDGTTLRLTREPEPGEFTESWPSRTGSLI